MGFAVDTRDVALMTEGAAALQVPTLAWLTHICCCAEVFMTEPIADDELGAVPSVCSSTGPEITEIRVTYLEHCLQHTQ